MKSEKKIFSLLFFIVFLSAVLYPPQIPAAYAAGEFAGAAEFGNSILNGIERAVGNTGIPNAKKELWDNFGLLFKPFLKSRYALTSNVFKSPNPDKTGNIWEITPGFQFLQQNDYGVIGGAYEATFRYFPGFSNQNAQDQKFLIYANLEPTDNVYVRLSEKLDRTRDVAGSQAFEPIDSTDNTVNAVLGYVMGRITHEFGYENFNKRFSNSTANRFNYNENRFDYRAYYELTEYARVYIGYRLGLLDFRRLDSRDTTYHEIPIGFEGMLPLDIMARASVGLHHRNIHNSARNDVTHVVANISLEKTFNESRTSVNAGFLRRPVESFFASATTYDEKLWYAGAKHLITERLRGRLNTYVGNRDFEERVFTGPLVVVGSRVFALAGTSQVKRDDHVFGFNFGFDYSLRKWLILHLDYQYSRRNSNISQLDYTENAFSLASTIPL